MFYVAGMATALETRTASAVDQAAGGSTAQESRQTGTMAGRVIEAGTSQPLGGAQVSVAGTSVGAVANAEGRFTLTNAPAGGVTVQVRLLGYAAGERTAAVRDGETATLDFELTPEAIALSAKVTAGPSFATR
ncbi:MAG: carboxypeptidase-like regulatory domain-containing protein [Longimicrobiales bacterium]